ncbi:tetratricopeptide repeat protein, partial [Paracraurococcus sp. LOR1-02]
MSSGAAAGHRLLDPTSTAAVVLGAHDWTDAGLSRAPSFRRSARGIVAYLYDPAGLGLDPELVLDLFDDPTGAGDQLARVRDTLDELLRERREVGRPVSDVLVYYVGHGFTDDQGHLSLLVRRSRRGLEAETGIKAPHLARMLRLAAPQQRRSVILDCCFSEAAARAFIGMASDLNQQVAATAAQDLGDDQPARGTLLLCSSPVGRVSMGAPNAERTLFTGAVLDVLRCGIEGRSPVLSFADLRDAAFERMVVSFGANAPRPALHQVNAAHGDLTRVPAFPNRAPARAAAPPLINSSSAPEKAAKSSPTPAQNFALARQHQTAGGEREAVSLFRLAADQGNAMGQANLGFSYRHGLGGLAQDDRKAAQLYRLAADQGDAFAQANLAFLYERGLGGLARDDREAARLYRLAADQGDAFAQANLGFFYEQGRGGLAQDDRKAAQLYRLAADQDNAFAQ